MKSACSITAMLSDKNDKVAYEFAKQIAYESEISARYYDCLPEFASLLTHKSSYVRTRAFILCCCQSKWDTEGKLRAILPEMFALLHDPKPTVVRQCLNAVKEVIVYRPELCPEIRAEVETVDITKYKDSMSPLIRRDIASVMELLNENREP